MALNWDNYDVKGTVTTVGGDMIALESNKAASDYSVLTINATAIKLTEQDLRDIVALISREAFPRLSVK